MRSLCVCLLPNTFKALVLCHDDAAVLCAALMFHILSWYVYCCYHPTSLQAPSQGSTHCQLLIYGRNDCFGCCKCIIHFNSVILILDFVRILLVVTWLICDMSPISLSHHSLQLRSITKLRSDLSTAEMSRLGKILHQLTWLVLTLTAADEHSQRRIRRIGIAPEPYF